MRKFIVYTRSLPAGCCKITTDAPAVIEVEGEVVGMQEDTSILWLPPHEFRFAITKPEFLQEPKEIVKPDGSKATIKVPLVYHSHSVYLNIHQAQIAAEHLVRDGFQFTKRKTGKDFTEEEVKAKFAEIQEIMLEN
jgi:hypothetical protein